MTLNIFNRKNQFPQSYDLYPDDLSVLSITFGFEPTQFGGFSFLHVNRQVVNGEVLFTHTVNTVTSSDPNEQFNLGRALGQAARFQNVHAGLDYEISLKCLTLHFLTIDREREHAPVICEALAKCCDHPIEINELFLRTDITAPDFSADDLIRLGNGPLPDFDWDQEKRAWEVKDAAALAQFLEARNRANWLTLVNYMLPVSEHDAAATSLERG
jgi:hypothetical protein